MMMNLQKATFVVSHYHDFGSHLRDHVVGRTQSCLDAGDEHFASINSLEALQQHQRDVRATLSESIGGLIESPVDLQMEEKGRVQYEGYEVVKLVYQSLPKVYIPAHLYLPKKLNGGACPAVLFLCGHSLLGKREKSYSNVCSQLARRGFVVLIPDPLGQGERLGFVDPDSGKPRVAGSTVEHDYAGVKCALIGENIARYMLRDAMCGLDLLCGLPEVDATRIGITGSSGGGTLGAMLMALDERVAAASIGTFLTSRRDLMQTGAAQDAEQIWRGFSRQGYDHRDLAVVFAPKPLLVLAVTYDSFPIEGTRKMVSEARKAWAFHGKPEGLDLAEDISVHAYTHELAMRSVEFFCQHFGLPVGDATPVAAEDVGCTLASGQVAYEYPDARFVHDLNRERYLQLEVASPPVGRDWLRRSINRHRTACSLNLRVVERLQFEVYDIAAAFWWTQPGMANIGLLFSPLERRPEAQLVLILLEEGTSTIEEHRALILKHLKMGSSVLVPDLSGMGALTPHPFTKGRLHEFYGPLHKLSDDLNWLGDSLAALRVYDFLRLPDVIAEWLGRSDIPCKVVAQGRAGFYAQFAAALDCRLRDFEWSDASDYREIVEHRFYDSQGIKEWMLPGALRFFERGAPL